MCRYERDAHGQGREIREHEAITVVFGLKRIFRLTTLVTMVAAMVKCLECFTGEEEVPLRSCVERFDAVIEAEGKEEKAAAVLLICLKGDASEVIHTMSAEDRKAINKIKSELIAQFYVRKLASVEAIRKYTRSLRQFAAEGFPKLTGETPDEVV